MDIQNKIWITQPAGPYSPRAHDVKMSLWLKKQLNGAWMLQ